MYTVKTTIVNDNCPAQYGFYVGRTDFLRLTDLLAFYGLHPYASVDAKSLGDALYTHRCLLVNQQLLVEIVE